jgi:cytoskeletal protein CcmA (bactofilin family)
MEELIASLEAEHGEDNDWVRYLKMSTSSPGDFEEIFKDRYYCFEDSMPKVEELANMVKTKLPPHVVEGDLSLSSPLIVAGDFEVKGDFYTSSVLIVLGDFKARFISDCGPDSLVVVRGNVGASILWTDGEFHVAGDIVASELVYGAYNDNVLVGATVKAPVVVQDDHAIEGDVEAEHHIAYESQAPLAEVFVDGAFDAERNKLDYGFLKEQLAAGKPVRR